MNLGRRFFREFLSVPETEAMAVLPRSWAGASLQLALPRLVFLAERDSTWWLTTVRFFNAERQRIWIFWRRVLHTAHHRTQLTVYVRLLEKPVPATYGPTGGCQLGGSGSDSERGRGAEEVMLRAGVRGSFAQNGRVMPRTLREIPPVTPPHQERHPPVTLTVTGALPYSVMCELRPRPQVCA
jgi:hypothetical protein